jgi:cytochrome c peroxidase
MKNWRLFFSSLTILLMGCHETQRHQWAAPPYAGAPLYVEEEGWPVTEQSIALGQRLFNDRNLSIDSTLSCASCHNANSYFADPGMAFSVGRNNEKTLRNSPGLINLAWQPYFFREGGVRNLKLSSFVPINHRNEFGRELHALVEQLRLDEDYQQAFEQAFEQGEISDHSFLTALAHFMASLTFYDSPYDHYLQGDTLALDNDERAGLKLFERHCFGCHAGPQLSTFAIESNGLPTNSDYGRMLISNNKSDSAKFKVPTLRGVEVTGPYMHDGSYATLDSVVWMYVKVRQLDLDSPAQQKLVSFLKSLD